MAELRFLPMISFTAILLISLLRKGEALFLSATFFESQIPKAMKTRPGKSEPGSVCHQNEDRSQS